MTRSGLPSLPWALALATMSPLLLAAAPSPTSPAMPTGTFALATVGRAVTTHHGLSALGATLAPMPNSSVSAPRAADADSKAPELSPSLFRPRKTYGGEGFIAGSNVQDQEQRKVGPAPGINLKVPLN